MLKQFDRYKYAKKENLYILPKLKISNLFVGIYTDKIKRQKAKTDYEIKRNTGHALNVSTCVVHNLLDKMTDGDEKLPEKNTRKEKLDAF